jgi:hypothetical protein
VKFAIIDVPLAVEFSITPLTSHGMSADSASSCRDGDRAMIKRIITPASLLLASALLPGTAAAAPWRDIGKAQMPSFGTGELYITGVERDSSGMVRARLHEVLDHSWEDPIQDGYFRDAYFRVLADCRNGMIAVHSTWPEGPDELAIPMDDLRRPAPGSVDSRLLQVSCAA